MDGNSGMNMRNWAFYEPPMGLKGHLGLQLMSSGAEKPLLGGRSHHPAVMADANGGPFHHHMPTNGGLFHHRVGGVSESPMPMDYVRDAWINHSREKYLNPLHGNHHHANFSVLPETSEVHHLQMLQPTESPKDDSIARMEETSAERESVGPLKKRPGSKPQKSPKPKKAKKAPRAPRDDGSVSMQRARPPPKSMEVVVNGVDIDISGIPIPVCSCTGTPQQCYRWGCGGWQSACCTTAMSMYPLPMNTKRRGARIAGRKMSLGAFKKVLEKLASEGYNFSNPIDLRTHWAKHGTNKFVTIR
ncbi:protein BASIC PENTACYSTEINE2-like [Actinidia eriantha]|uniref:protein BASIC PENTACYSTEINE2-like n=1 Tax=Actinidia eriantha TaxID=165200 RepID=UPI00258C6C66|nr:protein BASIC PENTACYSTEINE2-like [Actinidia eriantha]XP_057505431.1 protein BASIC PENTACYSTEINE2-like [Actinidia eriantha]XP_057505432.1 protein BASIC PENTACYSTEINE2-like [Actinidia eriantha]XP_057505433.1 protein BASIC PENTACYSTEINE2-like [Actinidia eriantha]XP_057505434.1 protein BASIC PENTACYSTEINE2-like [Actinidia eriantha]XP_057505435.1 protein BASIC PENTACYSTEINE2-like [Actinidia eriantha]